MFADEDVISYLSSDAPEWTKNSPEGHHGAPSFHLNGGKDGSQDIWPHSQVACHPRHRSLNFPLAAPASHQNADEEHHTNHILSTPASFHSWTEESTCELPPPPYPGGSNMARGSCSTLNDSGGFFNEHSITKLPASHSYDFRTDDLNSSNNGAQFVNTLQEVREVSLCRHDNEPYGMRIEAIGNSFYVTYLVRQSAAASAGLKVGDELVRVNNHVLINCCLSEVLTHIRETELSVNLAYKPRAVVARTREVIVEKMNGVFGLRLIRKNDGLYIDFVKAETAASYAGLKEGDQVLKINSNCVTAWSCETAMSMIKAVPDNSKLTLCIQEMLPLAHIQASSVLSSNAADPHVLSSLTPQLQFTNENDKSHSENLNNSQSHVYKEDPPDVSI